VLCHNSVRHGGHLQPCFLATLTLTRYSSPHQLEGLRVARQFCRKRILSSTATVASRRSFPKAHSFWRVERSEEAPSWKIPGRRNAKRAPALAARLPCISGPSSPQPARARVTLGCACPDSGRSYHDDTRINTGKSSLLISRRFGCGQHTISLVPNLLSGRRLRLGLESHLICRSRLMRNPFYKPHPAHSILYPPRSRTLSCSIYTSMLRPTTTVDRACILHLRNIASVR
jgi:hypothetical protein